MAHPLRIQLSRQKGYRMPPGAVVVSRPSKWGNPFRLVEQLYSHPTFEASLEQFRGYGRFSDPAACVEMFRFWARFSPEAEPLRAQAVLFLRGKQLACWCNLDAPCHADVWCELANP